MYFADCYLSLISAKKAFDLVNNKLPVKLAVDGDTSSAEDRCTIVNNKYHELTSVVIDLKQEVDILGVEILPTISTNPRCKWLGNGIIIREFLNPTWREKALLLHQWVWFVYVR